MPKAIAYSIFGIGSGAYKDCYEPRHYIRGLEFNIRVAKLIYPEYKIFVALDQQTYDSHYKDYFDYHKDNGTIDISVQSKKTLCEMMLWRLLPAFMDYDRVLCRDADSLLCYKERQMTAMWEWSGRVAHCITDSVSHNIPMMGGLVGFQCKEFREAIGCYTFQQLVSMGRYDYSVKGTDQKLLNDKVLPKVAHSMIEHYLLGMPNSFRDGYYNKVPDTDFGTPVEYKELDALAWHCGASGFQEVGTLKFLDKYGKENEYFNVIEKKFASTFYWHL
jgi:hypothetical protein